MTNGGIAGRGGGRGWERNGGGRYGSGGGRGGGRGGDRGNGRRTEPLPAVFSVHKGEVVKVGGVSGQGAATVGGGSVARVAKGRVGEKKHQSLVAYSRVVLSPFYVALL